ncbi:hypothetical protein AAV94_04855 [Lampropedia cohaerens]|uniref:histidine kinase n=1 Tax=Lampropedia cohaerens TaxID=1610491 RepID=A0A0U1Q104_9BURK|nr:ATP-binding protein [Lampropedia cohaerens]KKW68437.1 hypothetical protein AAV94_04855 [Lampropedia cohaerens]
MLKRSPHAPTPATAQTSLAKQLTHALLLTTAAVWAVCIVGVAWFIYAKTNENFDYELMESAHRLLDVAVHQYDAHPLTGTPIIAQDPLINDLPLIYQVLDAQGNVVLRSRAAPVQPFNAPLQTGFADLGPWRIYTVEHPYRPLFLQLADPLEERWTVLINALLTLVLVMVAVLVALGLLLRVVAARKLSVLQRLQRQISLRSGTDLRPVQTAGMPQELRSVAEDVNRMLQRLSDALDVERTLAANAAHELRTPLATATLHLQAALDGQLERSDIQAALAGLKNLAHRTEKLLQLSRAEAVSSVGLHAVSLLELATAVAGEFWISENAQQRLDVLETNAPAATEHASAVALADPDALAIALRNLIENALRYSDNAKVEVLVQAPATVIVRDHGPGVSPELLSTLQTRHVRQAHDRAGYGLGMSITSSIVRGLRGQLRLSSPPAGLHHGFEARMELIPAIMDPLGGAHVTPQENAAPSLR